MPWADTIALHPWVHDDVLFRTLWEFWCFLCHFPCQCCNVKSTGNRSNSLLCDKSLSQAPLPARWQAPVMCQWARVTLSALVALGSWRGETLSGNDMRWPTLQNVPGHGERVLRSPAFTRGQGNNHTRLAAHGWISYLRNRVLLIKTVVSKMGGVRGVCFQWRTAASLTGLSEHLLKNQITQTCH